MQTIFSYHNDTIILLKKMNDMILADELHINFPRIHHPLHPSNFHSSPEMTGLITVYLPNLVTLAPIMFYRKLISLFGFSKLERRFSLLVAL